MFISNAGTDISDGMVVMAATGSKENGRPILSSFIVPRNTPGFKLGQSFDKMAWHGMDNRELVFEDAIVPAKNLLGVEGAGLKRPLGPSTLAELFLVRLAWALFKLVLMNR